MSAAHEGAFDALRTQLREAATTFADGPDALEGILLGMVDDVDRAVREPLEIFPVCHHSPASAVAMARRLREKRPKVVTGPDGEDTLAIRTCCYFSLSFDHKVVDGADADRFMGDIKKALESFPEAGV